MNAGDRTVTGLCSRGGEKGGKGAKQTSNGMVDGEVGSG